MIAGGLHAWQVLCFPIILLATTRISMWAWMAGGLYSPRPAVLLAGSGLLALACLVGSLWYRLVEIPDVGEPFDVKAFAAGIPGPEHNESRQAIQEALQESQERQIAADSQAPPPKPIRLPQDAQPAPAKTHGDAARPAGPPDIVVEEAQIPIRNYYELIEHVLDGLVPASDPQVGKWLDLVFQGDWMKHLSEAVQLPLAVFTDPCTANLASNGKIEHSASQTARAILARALQLQSQKKNAEALDHIQTVLALSRHLRHKAGTYYYLSGLTIEKLAIEALDQWVHDLGHQPQLLRRAAEELGEDPFRGAGRTGGGRNHRLFHVAVKKEAPATCWRRQTIFECHSCGALLLPPERGVTLVAGGLDVGQQVAYQHQFGRNRNSVSIGQDKDEDRNEGDDLSQR